MTDTLTGHTIRVFPATLDYVEKMHDLQQAVYAPIFGVGGGYIHKPQLTGQITRFPHGQIIACDVNADRVVGMGLSMQTDVGPDRVHTESWEDITDGGMITRHDPSARWLYGVENCVRPEYQGRGVGGAIMRARFELTRRLNLRGMVGGSMIVSYSTVADTVPVEQYVAEVVAGKRHDANLSKQIRAGWTPATIMPNYYAYPPARDYGVVIVWHNHDHDPAQPVTQTVKSPMSTFRLRSPCAV